MTVHDMDSTTLAFAISGSGPPLLLVHAGIADSRMWEPQVRELTSHFTVVTCDLRGYGVTPRSDDQFAHLDDLRALLEQLQIERVHLLGLSMGASVAMDFALTFPSMVDRLVLCAALGPPPRSETLVAGFARAEQAYEKGGLAALNEVEMQLWVDGPTRSADQVDPKLRAFVAGMNLIALTSEEIAKFEPTPIDPSADSRLAEITMPTLILAGDIDQPDVLDYAYRLAAGIPDSKLEIIPGVAHMINLEAAGRFNELVTAFLSG